jgi:hypothetical protein
MSKGSFFTGQPIFNQIISLIPCSVIRKCVRVHQSDRYCKRFSSYDHLVTMLYCIFNHCSTLREVTTGLLAWEQRITHLGMRYHPRRSTISDANNRRTEKVFEDIYLGLVGRYQHLLSDSRTKSKTANLYIFDSTVITLFQEVLNGSGIRSFDGRRKGGIKVHTLMRADQDVPCMVRYGPGADGDSKYLKDVHLPKGSVLVFDRGYRNYKTFNRFSKEGITWITRLRNRTTYTVIEERSISDQLKQQGIVNDQHVILGHDFDPKATKVKCRLITYLDPQTKKYLEFLTDNTKMSPLTIANYYRKRWQIELLFKRLKQNYPLKYFLGDSENAIKIQIWCALIADLLLKVIKAVTKSKMAFSNITGLIRLHLMTYMNIIDFLKSPETSLLKNLQQQQQLIAPSLFSP